MKPRVFVPAILSGLLLWTAYFPLDLGPVAFVALVPWLTLARAPVSGRRRYLAAYLGGFAFFLVALQWLPSAHRMMYLSWAGLALVCPLFWCAGLHLVRRLDRLGVPLALSVPVAWVGLEYARAHFPTGFPFLQSVGLYQMIGFGWYFLGYTQHEFLPLVQVADLGGVYAVSFLVAAVNGLAVEWAVRSEAVRRWLRWESRQVQGQQPCSRDAESSERSPYPRPVASTAAVAGLFAAAVGYGAWQLDHPPFPDGPRVAAIQGSMPQAEKMKRGQSLAATYYGLYKAAARETPAPDLVVWPETCCPFAWYEVGEGADPKAVGERFLSYGREEVTGLYREHRPVPTLYGLNALVWEADGQAWKYNSAVLLDPRGVFAGRYDKMHLVPFGEYVPLQETLPFMSWFTPYRHDYSCRPGERWTRFPLRAGDGRAFTLGCLICYEDSDPYLARQYAGADRPVDFLVNISNDGWFDGTEEHEQHLAICRFRAVEARRAVVRAVNMGVSGVIDPDGRVIALPADTWSGSKKVEGVVSAVVPIDTRTSWYARVGDWLPAGCWAVVALGWVAPVLRRRPVSPRPLAV